MGPPVPIPTTWVYRFAITPDNKYLVMVNIEPGGGYHSLDVVKIGDDGSLTWLTDKRLVIKGSPSDMEFVPFWRETLAPPHGWLAH